MIRLGCLLCALAGPAFPEALITPRFEPKHLPVAHVYDGGWEHFVGGGVAVFDCDGDHLPEIFAAGGENPAQLFRNRGDFRFETADIVLPTGVTGAYPIDIDSDGQTDLAVLRVGANLFLRGRGDCSFEDATARWGIDPGAAWSTAFSATWEPGQHWPTLAIGNYVDRADPDGPFEACDDNEVHRWDGQSYQRQVLRPGHCALSMLFSDWALRGHADLRVSNDRHYYIRDGSEQMWAMPELRLRHGEGWEPIRIWGMGIASRDLDGDRRPEVMLTSMGDQLLQLATPQGYRNASYHRGATAQRPYIGDDGRPSTGWHAEFGDVNNDGRADLFIAKGNVDQMPDMAMADPNNLLIQTADGRFAEYGEIAGIASVARGRGAALSDFDRDGRLDLVVVNRRAPMELYRNVTPGAGPYLSLRLRQRGHNPDAIGAVLEVHSAAGRQFFERTIGGGHVGGQLGPIHIGLAPQTESARLRVHWPDGQTSIWFRPEVSRAWEIRREGGRAVLLPN